MKTKRDILHSRTTPVVNSQIPHVIHPADFNTSYPDPNHIDRIAREVDEYLNWKRKRANISKN